MSTIVSLPALVALIPIVLKQNYYRAMLVSDQRKSAIVKLIPLLTLDSPVYMVKRAY